MGSAAWYTHVWIYDILLLWKRCIGCCNKRGRNEHLLCLYLGGFALDMAVSTLLNGATVGMEPKALERKSYWLGQSRAPDWNWKLCLGPGITEIQISDLEGTTGECWLWPGALRAGNRLRLWFPGCTQPWEPQWTHWKRVWGCWEICNIFDIRQTPWKLLAPQSLQFNSNLTTFPLVMLYFVKLSFGWLPAGGAYKWRWVGSGKWAWSNLTPESATCSAEPRPVSK